MGKRIRVQRRGRGGPTFRSSTHKRIAPARYPTAFKELTGVITKFIHDPGRGTPLAAIKLENGKTCYNVVPEGVSVGQKIRIGSSASIQVGNILPIIRIPEGTIICNIELHPGDGGKIAKASGSYATIVTHTNRGTMIKLPSGKTKYIADSCRATIGVIAGAGRTEKPFLKAGTKFHLMAAKGHKYPRTRGRAMVAAAHPYGSSKKGARRVTTVARGAPPGQKVGLIAARSAGQKRKKRRQ